VDQGLQQAASCGRARDVTLFATSTRTGTRSAARSASVVPAGSGRGRRVSFGSPRVRNRCAPGQRRPVRAFDGCPGTGNLVVLDTGSIDRLGRWPTGRGHAMRRAGRRDRSSRVEHPVRHAERGRRPLRGDRRLVLRLLDELGVPLTRTVARPLYAGCSRHQFVPRAGPATHTAPPGCCGRCRSPRWPAVAGQSHVRWLVHVSSVLSRQSIGAARVSLGPPRFA